jgi:ribosome-associated protein
MIRINPNISLDDNEVEISFVRSSGPGGQNVNKVSTAAELRFDVKGSPSLPEDVKLRLAALAGRRMTHEGVLIIDARRHRTQGQNRQDAMDRLAELIRQAAHVPRRRRKTAPTAASRRRRLDDKRKHGETKRLRGPIE